MILTAAISKPDNRARRKLALVGSVWPFPLALLTLLATHPATMIPLFISSLPPLIYSARLIARHWRAFGLAFLGMNALIILSFALWLALNLRLLATQTAIAALVGLAAVVLVRRVRGADAGGWR